ncbi:GNAT family N-acetyltransferase [Microbacterium kribbense]|uniref:GNAT family N-acetyltransferase n=1 Tax=Microbacterium kribbense TaxID=433645 RepID=A0ABP7FY70_9MICO
MSTDSGVTVVRSDEYHRYEVRVDEELAGFTEFRIEQPGRLRFPETMVIPSFRGRGLAGILVAEAMADVAARGETVVPLCPVVVRYLHEHDVPGLVVDWPESR